MNKTLEMVLAVVIVGSTLAFGGVQPISYTLMEIALFAALLALRLRQTRQGSVRTLLPLWPALFAAWVGLELVPLPASLVGAIVPARLRSPRPPGLAPRDWITLSIYPHDTLLIWIRLLSYLAAFVLAAYLFDSRRRKSLLVQVLIFLGLFEAAYGIVQYLTGWQKIFTYTKIYYTSEATGTYINHNHFAGFLELTFPFMVGAIFYWFQTWSGNRRAVLSPDSAAGAAGNRAILYAFLLVVMMVGVIFSRSRGGILAAAFSLVFIGLLAGLKSRRGAWMLGLFVFLVLAVGYGLWIGLNPVLARFEAIGTASFNYWEGRPAFWRDTLAMIRDYPWTGVGLGNFQFGFRHYQSSFVTFFVDHAHNDYLEFTSETGLVGAALLFLPILYLLIRMIVSFLTDSRRYRPAILLGCIGSVLGILVHSVTDFNLQVPANALIFAVVLGIGYKLACLEPREERTREPERRATVPVR